MKSIFKKEKIDENLKSRDVKHDGNMQTKLLIIAAALSFSSLVAYIVTRDAHVLDSAFTSPFVIVVGYCFGRRRS